LSDEPNAAGLQVRHAALRLSHPEWSRAAWGGVALGAAVASILAAPGLSGLLGAALACVMIAVAAVDARHFVIPDLLVLAGLVLGLVAAALDRSEAMTTAVAAAVLRGFLLALIFFVFRAAYRSIRGRDGIGLGDVKLAAVAGVWLSAMGAAIAIDIAALSALVVVVVRMFCGERVGATTVIPFGLFFAPAIWIAWLFEAISPRFLG
jgi:leader peptidase (prepilin peptidase) / N-methyltransferase